MQIINANSLWRTGQEWPAVGIVLSAEYAKFKQACRAGEMAEWLKAHAWKACIGETLSRVRIPVSPPETLLKSL